MIKVLSGKIEELDMKETLRYLGYAGVAYATEQVIDLYANGIKAVHIYSMNKPEVARAIKANLSDII